MDAVVYTRDEEEYRLIRELLQNESAHIDVYRYLLNGHKRYDDDYDIAVVALDGAEGMEVMLEYAERFPETNVIWITSDPFFAEMALRNHIYDFIERPYDRDRIERSIQEVVPLCRGRNRWIIPPREKVNAVLAR